MSDDEDKSVGKTRSRAITGRLPLAGSQSAVAVHPADVLLQIALHAQRAGQTSQAEAAYRDFLDHVPSHATAWSNLGMLLADTGRPDEAEAAYRTALKHDPGRASTLNNLGNLLDKMKRGDEAEQAYLEAIRLEPRLAQAHNNLGALHAARNLLGKAEAAYRCALECQPDCAEAYNNLGIVLHRQHRLAESEAAFRKAFALDPRLGQALSKISYIKRVAADWRGLSEDDAQAIAYIEQGRTSDFTPFTLLPMPEARPEHLLAAARLRCTSTLRPYLDQAPLAGTARSMEGRPLRLGYLSADFHAHATAHLLAGVIESHDPAGFSVHLFSYGPAANDSLRQRLQAASAGFHDLSGLSDRQAARSIAAQAIDLLVDLKGFTHGCRSAITAQRPAPVIVNWLGYPGSLGNPRLADYFIGDPVASPLEHAGHFSETLALMPHCYQPNDRSRRIGAVSTRRAVGLPEIGFVFCSLNQTYKINPDMFDAWCRLLHAVPGSVLWLLAPKSAEAISNLRREASERGIAPSRLVFAPQVGQAEHLARLRLADLALDTFPVTSHTTGSDALWAGLPMVTRMGLTFVSRVAASLLHAVGLPELVASDATGYFELALALARDPARLADLRMRLDRQRTIAPLFDTETFTRELEQLYRTMWRQTIEGKREAILP